MTSTVSIVVPVLNCERTIAGSISQLLHFLAGTGKGSELVVVDDGSRDGTVREVQRAFAISNTSVTRRLLENSINRGKDHAVRRGMLAARGARRLFIDADLAYPVVNIGRMLSALDEGADLAIASRMQDGSQYVMSPDYFRQIYFRHVIGRLFNAITRAAILNGIRDTQAGLKGMTASATERLFPQLRLERFSFDVELLFLAQRAGLRIDEVPVTFVYSNQPSTLALGRDSLRMLSDLARIRIHAARGDYDRRPTLPAEAAPLPPESAKSE